MINLRSQNYLKIFTTPKYDLDREKLIVMLLVYEKIHTFFPTFRS